MMVGICFAACVCFYTIYTQGIFTIYTPSGSRGTNAKTSFLFHDISDGMQYVQLTLKKVVQNRQENKDRMKIEENAIVRNISAFKASVIKKLDELETSALLELQTVSQDSIGQMVKEETEVNNSVLTVHGVFCNRIVPKVFISDNKCSGCS
jgi:hypothetical protein